MESRRAQGMAGLLSQASGFVAERVWSIELFILTHLLLLSAVECTSELDSLRGTKPSRRRAVAVIQSRSRAAAAPRGLSYATIFASLGRLDRPRWPTHGRRWLPCSETLGGFTAGMVSSDGLPGAAEIARHAASLDAGVLFSSVLSQTGAHKRRQARGSTRRTFRDH